MPKQRKITGNISDSYVASLMRPSGAQTIEAENQKFFDRMDRRYARIHSWASDRSKDDVTDHLALLLLLTLEDKRHVSVREEVKDGMLDAAYGQLRNRWIGSKKGGREAGKKKATEAAEWQVRCVDKAHALIAQGKPRREVAGILAIQFKVTSRQVRAVLKKAEVK